MLFGVLDRLLDFAFDIGLDGCLGSLRSSERARLLERDGSELISNTSGSALFRAVSSSFFSSSPAPSVCCFFLASRERDRVELPLGVRAFLSAVGGGG